MKTQKFLKSLQVTAAIVALASAGILIPGESFAGLQQGTLGSTSFGTVDISVTKPAQAQITDLSDTNLTVASWTVGSGDLALYTHACIYSTGAAGSTAGNYTLTVTGANGGVSTAVNGGFYLFDGTGTAGTGGASHNIPYTPTWATEAQGTSQTAGGTAIVYGTPLAVTGGDSTAADCSDLTPAYNFNLNVTILTADLDAATAGAFADTLTLLITPN